MDVSHLGFLHLAPASCVGLRIESFSASNITRQAKAEAGLRNSRCWMEHSHQEPGKDQANASGNLEKFEQNDFPRQKQRR
jgi:hypothetical protein